jgi:hypothetical protein
VAHIGIHCESRGTKRINIQTIIALSDKQLAASVPRAASQSWLFCHVATWPPSAKNSLPASIPDNGSKMVNSAPTIRLRVKACLPFDQHLLVVTAFHYIDNADLSATSAIVITVLLSAQIEK